jgi:hypothetical protein
MAATLTYRGLRIFSTGTPLLTMENTFQPKRNRLNAYISKLMGYHLQKYNVRSHYRISCFCGGLKKRVVPYTGVDSP